MPTYNFKNTKTGEVIEKYCSIATRDEMVASGEWEMYHTDQGAGLVDPVRLGIRKPDQGFRDLLKDMKKRHSRRHITKSTINDW